MMRNLSILFSGVLFSLGLFVSGMTNPTKIFDFLDLFGNWDPSLLFVMLSAVLTTAILYRLIMKRTSPIFSDIFDLPTKKNIDQKLVWGAMIFGVGWGLSGVCPGPAVANVFAGNLGFAVFVLAMMIGMMIGNKK